LGTFLEQGYFILPNRVPESLLSQAKNALDDLWNGNSCWNDLNIHVVSKDGHHDYQHQEIAAFPDNVRRDMRDNNSWRVHALHLFDPRINSAVISEKIQTFVDAILGRPGAMWATNAFMLGQHSGSDAHQDYVHFPIHPNDHIIGVWIALEDIHDDVGPLYLVPTSHKEPLFQSLSPPPLVSYVDS